MIDFMARKSYNLFLVGYSNGQISIFNAASPPFKIAEIQAHSRQVNGIAVHPSRPLFVSVSDDTFMNVWEVPNSDTFSVNLHSSTRCNDLQLTGVQFVSSEEGQPCDKIVASVYSYKTVVVKELAKK
jgi:WD40 repeat protein